MSKTEHDTRVAELRGATTHYDRPWYKSAAIVLQRRGLLGLNCLDLCAGNAEFSEILRDRFDMKVTCADYAPAHLKRHQELGFKTLPVDLDANTESVDATASKHAGAFDLVVSLATIEHIFDSDNLLRFAHTVLRPEGMLLVNTPNISFAGYRIYSCLSGNRPFGEGHHVRFWDYSFLRTNIFLNGFQVIEDARRFFSLPLDQLVRAFRGRRRVAAIIANFFHACQLLQHLPGGKNWFADELTVMAKREDVYPVGFQFLRVRKELARLHGLPEEAPALARLNEARRLGWLREHLMLDALVAERCGEKL
ncbi:MAG: methyltransferase domain-containing protein [Deltaproteobacteria bacterium]|nr:methyltransferase domain-containing protein [Deltaproteobacteria bacterium]